jgi:outer membrane protein assembly factor BamD (BamD/ComL family)
MALAPRQPEPRRRRPALRLGAALAVLLASPGCQALSAWRMGHDSSLSRGPTAEELGDDRNLMARWLSPKAGTPTGAAAPRSPLVLGSNGWRPMKATPNPEADAEFQAAETLLKEGKASEAEAALKKIVKNRKGTPWGEKAQFALAESYFRQGRFVKAHDNYETHFADYPGTQYLDTLVSREYEIAQNWLAQADPKTKPEKIIPWTGRFEGRLPMIDTTGHALQVLEHVRQHDPTGPLADDAVLRIADLHLENGAFELAAMHYDQLATDHPKSPFLQRAQLASIDARIKDYIGPEYDGEGLEKAREMIKQTMATFPDRPDGNEKLYHTLDLINDQDAERTYVIADYYRRTGKVASAEFYYGKLRHRYPKSPWAAKAKTQLAALAKMPRKETLPSKIMAAPGSIDSFNSSGGGGMGGMSPMGGGMPGMGMMGAPGGMM